MINANDNSQMISGFWTQSLESITGPPTPHSLPQNARRRESRSLNSWPAPGATSWQTIRC